MNIKQITKVIAFTSDLLLARVVRTERLQREAAKQVRSIFQLLGLLIIVFAGNIANAAIYYVDSITGNDNWAGTIPTAISNPANGPWQTLHKVSLANLLPGDTVRFKCGSVWHETLNLSKSGSSTAPIRFGTYGTGCQVAPPTIDGSNSVVGWQRHGAITSAIWKARVGFDVTQVMVDGQFIKPAQHPNVGFDSQNPTNTFLSISAAQTKLQHSSIKTDNNLRLLPNQDLIGAGIHVRTNDYTLEYRPIQNFNPANKIITLSAATNYEMQEGYGYYLVNKFWMLDSPGEWYLEKTKTPTGQIIRTLYVWLSNSQMPATSATATTNIVNATPDGRNGIVAHSAAYLIFAGLRLINQNVGIDLSGLERNQLANHKLMGISVENSALVGLKLDHSANISVDKATIRNSGYQGVHGNYSTGLWVTRSTIDNSGTVGSPRGSNPPNADYQLDGIYCYICKEAKFTDNTIRNAGYSSIILYTKGGDALPPSNLVAGNYLNNACAVLDDCGAFYGTGRNGEDHNGFVDKTQIINNIVVNSTGNPNGRPIDSQGSAQGIYLDDYSHGPVVTGNTVVNADNGLQIHLGSNIFASKNSLFANRRNAIWMQENYYPANFDSCPPDGNNCIKNNIIHDNLIFPRRSSIAVAEDSDNQSTTDFAAFNLNRYALLYGSQMFEEQHVTGGQLVGNQFNLEQWRSNRNQDLNSSSFNAFGIAPWIITAGLPASPNFLVNSTFSNDISNWATFPADATMGLVTACVTGSCLRFTANSTKSILSSNRFTIKANRLYLLKFNIKSATSRTNTDVLIRKNGPGATDYYVLAPARTIAVDNTWRSHSFALMATTDAADINGGRLDFEIPTSQTIYLDNIEVRDVTPLANLVTNSVFDVTVDDWASYPDDSALSWEKCPTGGCLKLVAGSSNPTSIAISNSYRVQKGKRYLLRFEAKSLTKNTPVFAFLRRNGPTYESLTIPDNTEFRFNPDWQSFNTILTATADALDTNGGRIDFEIPANQTVSFDNVLVTDISNQFNDTRADAKIFVNPNTTPLQIMCPNANITDARQCGNYAHFWDGTAHATPVTWPLTIRAKDSKIVIWSANPYRDTDFDGISDTNDLCPKTVNSVSVNERGCSYTQSH